MRAIDQVSDQHILTLGKFIVGCSRAKSSTRWRGYLAQCERHASFLPYVTLQDQEHMFAMVKRHGLGLLVGLNTSQVMIAANEVAKEWGEDPLTFATPGAQVTAVIHATPV